MGCLRLDILEQSYLQSADQLPCFLNVVHKQENFLVQENHPEVIFVQLEIYLNSKKSVLIACSVNGRLYDPQLRRFLAPDNNIQDPYDTRSYDRKAYVWYNPLMASDPSGEIIQFIILGAVMGAFNAAANGGNFGEILLGAVIGGIAGGLGAGVANLAAGGGFFSGAALNVTGGFAGGFVSGFAGGFVGGFVGATLNGLASGQNIGEAIGGGLRAGVTAGVLAGLSAGIGAGVKAKKAGASFWDGTKDTPLVSSVNEITAKGIQPFEGAQPQGGDLSGLRRIEANKPPHWPTEHKVVTSEYNLSRVHPEKGIIKAHTGVDMRSYLNNNNYAIHDGVVSEVYTQGQGSGGNYIKINHGNGIESGYFHTKSNLNVGNIVRRGQIIGVSDGSGIINAPHLHFTLKVNTKLVNPMEYLNFLGKIEYK